jgi:thioredoxin 1
MAEISTLEDFESKVIKSKEPVLVDFSATWCGPCKALAPRLHELEAEGKIKVFMIDIDKLRDLAVKFRIMSVPTVFIFSGGKPVDSVIGLVSKEELEERIARVKKSK